MESTNKDSRIIGAGKCNRNITKRENVENQLEESERWFRALIEQSPLAIEILTPEGRITQVNAAWMRLWGLNEEETTQVLAKYNMLADKEAENRGIMPLIRKAFAGESVVLPQIHYVGNRTAKDIGLERLKVNSPWIQCHLSPVKNTNQEIMFVVNTYVDITERKKAEEDIARQAKLLDLIFKHSLDSIVLLDKDYNFIWVSETYAKSCQRDSSEFAGHNHFEFYPSKLKEEFDAVKKRKGIYLKYARPFIFPDHPEWGTTYWDLGLVPIFDDDGEIEMFLFTLKDITERKKTQERLEESEKKYRELVEDINDAIYSVDTKGNVVYISPAIKSLLGYEPNELIGKHFSDLVHPDDLQAMKKAFEPSLVGKATPADYRILNKDGSYTWVRALSNPIKDDKNNIIGIRGVVSDINERKHMEEAIQKSQDSLRFLAGKLITAQEEERRRLAREMHDDLTQRLALLAIEAGKLEIESQKYDSSMHANLQEMKKKIIKLSKDIHDISRQIHPSILDDLGLVKAIESECAAFTQREDIQVEYEADNVPLSIPRSVKICIYRIIQEGLRNIAKHAGTDKAHVSLTCSDGNLFLTIRDNGIGFDTSHMQGQKGIGLRSMEERVRLIQGEFSVQSKPGEGTVIKVTAPFAEEQK
jgi:PAS domain S-box-containing protein